MHAITNQRPLHGHSQAPLSCAPRFAPGLMLTACAATLLIHSAAFAGTVKSGSGVTTHSLSAHRAASYGGRTNNDVTLDFVAADINDVLKALAVQTGANIVSSADVKGTITVSLAHVTLEQALDMVARLSGYEYAKANNAYIVGTPASIAQFGSPGGMAATPNVTEVVALHYTTIDDVTSLLKLRFPNIQVSSGTQIAGARVGTSSSAIVLYGPQDQVDTAKQLISSLEASMSQRVAAETTETYTVRYANLGDVIGILNTLVPSLVVTPGPGLGFNTKAPSASAAAASSSSSSAGTSSTGAQPSASSGASSSGGSGYSSGGGATGASQSSLIGPTMLLLTGTAPDIARARQVLAKIDTKPIQLLYETKVTEINNNDQTNIGLNWDFTKATTSIGELVPPGYDPGKPINPVNYPGRILKFGTFARSPIFELANVTLDFLINNGRAKLLANPNIASVDGYPAQVFIGDTVNYIQSITTSTTGQNITTASVQVGVILRVTGKYDPDGYITLNIHPEVSSISQFTPTPGGGQLPDIATRYADTTIRVKDGQTIAIGGLIQDNDIVTLQKVPFFGDLPFFGNFFRDTKHNHQKTEVVFFLKTSVLKDV